MYQTISEEAWGLVHGIATQSASQHGIGTFSCAAYDTAWVAMTEKEGEDGKVRPLFPEAYDYLKETQAEDGTWAAETSDADGIINTLAALLALKRQERQFEAARLDNERRCAAAEGALRRLLSQWDIESSDRVGLEVLVPNLLRLLETEGVQFDFPSRKALMALNAAKLAKLGPVLTSSIQTTLIHTLEAFVGTLDFDKVKQHKMPNGSMLASPSSTAAYLMNTSTWDDEAEAYLRTVFDQKSQAGYRGGFPSAFPSTIFEVSWVLDTLLEAGFDREEFLREDIRKLTVLLETNMKAQNGIVGFAYGTLPDADDTAKTISALRLLGWDKDVEPMLKAFEAENSFITYRGERNASSSANCNILSCLLRAPEPARYTKQIVKCASFLSTAWMSNNGPDKWHTSVQYPMMLLAQAFMLFLKRWGKKELDMDSVPATLVYQDIPRTLLDILARTMRSQNPDGSWESRREVTAYAVLTLAPLLSLPWVDFLKPEGIASMYRGKAYLEDNRNRWKQAEILWIEKTAYSSTNLSQAYCLAASKIVVPTTALPGKVFDIFPAQLCAKMSSMTPSFSQLLPLAPMWKLQLSMLQGVQYAAALKGADNIFPPMAKKSGQEYVPFSWIVCKDHLSTSVPAKVLWEMMLVFKFNFQASAYLETVVWDQYRSKQPALKTLIHSLCSGKTQHLKRGSECEIGGTPKKILQANGACDGTSKYSINGSSHEMAKDSATDTPGSNGCEDEYGTTAGTHINGINGKVHTNGQSEASNGHVASQAGNPKNGACQADIHGISNGANGRAVNGRQNGIEALTNGEQNNKSTTTKRKDSGADIKAARIQTDPVKRLIQTLSDGGTRAEQEIEEVLAKFVNHTLQHPKVLSSPPILRAWLARELQTFLLAHITSLEDRTDRSASTLGQLCIGGLDRARSTFTDCTGMSHAFAFFLILIGNGRNIVANAHQRYALDDAGCHLAAMYRHHRDSASVAREDKSLLGAAVPDFDFIGVTEGALGPVELARQRKRDLLTVAAYERRCLDRVVGELEQSLDSTTMDALELFIQVTDLYGRIDFVQ